MLTQPSPVWAAAGEHARERSSGDGKARSARRSRVPWGPHAPFWQLALLAGSSMGPGRTDRPTDARAAGAPGSPAPEQVAETRPGLAGVREAAGVGPRGGENDAARRRTVPGEESPRRLEQLPGSGAQRLRCQHKGTRPPGVRRLPGIPGGSRPVAGGAGAWWNPLTPTRAGGKGAGPLTPPLRGAGTAQLPRQGQS